MFRKKTIGADEGSPETETALELAPEWTPKRASDHMPEPLDNPVARVYCYRSNLTPTACSAFGNLTPR